MHRVSPETHDYYFALSGVPLSYGVSVTALFLTLSLSAGFGELEEEWEIFYPLLRCKGLSPWHDSEPRVPG